jgi:hypothetical protein
MLAVHPSIKPENQSFIKEKEENGHEWKPPRRGRDASCLSINQTTNQYILWKQASHNHYL